MPFVADLAANKLEATWKRGFRWRPAYLAIRPGRELRRRPRPSAHSPPLPALRWTTRLPLRHEPSGACNVAQFVAVGGHGRRSSGARCAARCGASPWTHWLDPSMVALPGGACRACAFGGRAGCPCVHSPLDPGRPAVRRSAPHLLLLPRQGGVASRGVPTARTGRACGLSLSSAAVRARSAGVGGKFELRGDGRRFAAAGAPMRIK